VVGAYLVAGAWTGLAIAAVTLWPDRVRPGAVREGRARAWGVGITLALGAVASVALVRSLSDLDVGGLAADRTGLLIAGALCGTAGAGLMAAVVTLAARGSGATGRR
jgi:hypothetical protein